MTMTATIAPTPSQCHSRIEAGPGTGTTDMDVDVNTINSNKAEAKAEVEMDCPTSRAPSQAASPLLQQQRLTVHSGALEAVGLGLEAEVPLVGRAGSCCSRWAIRSLHGPAGWAGSSSG